MFGKIGNWTINKITDLDIFGVPVTLNFNGKDKFKTFWGGWTSLVLTILIVIIAILSLVTLLQKGNSELISRTNSNNLVYDNTMHYFRQKGFLISIYGISNFSSSILQDSSYLEISAKEYTYTRDSVGGTIPPVITSRTLTIDRWLDKWADIIGYDFASTAGMNATYCIQEDDIKVGGNLLGTEYSYIEIDISQWQSGSCQSTTDIDNAAQLYKIGTAVSRYYFDSNDYENPLKVNLLTGDRWSLLPGYTRYVNLLLKKYTASDFTNLFYSINPSTYEYYTVDHSSQDLYVQEADKDYLRVILSVDSDYTEIERRVYTLFDWFGEIGGIIGLFTLLTGLLVGMFSENIYINTLLSNLYFVSSDKDTEKLSSKVAPDTISKIDTDRSHKNLNQEWYFSNQVIFSYFWLINLNKFFLILKLNNFWGIENIQFFTLIKVTLIIFYIVKWREHR